MDSGKKRKRASRESHPSQPGPALYQQNGSMLFQLPQELRLSIYPHVFCSMRLEWGERADMVSGPRTRPGRETLALILTCRRARDEIDDTWIGKVLLSFERPEAMLDKLTPLPAAALSKIRHVWVSGLPLILEFGEDNDDRGIYSLASALKIIPGLHLDTLTVDDKCIVHDKPIAGEGYNTINDLISNSCGWKELYYVSTKFLLLGFASVLEMCYRQPALWQSVMNSRDGAETKPSVAIYRSARYNLPGSIMDPATRVILDQKMPDNWMGEQDICRREDQSLTNDDENGKEMVIVIKRGFGVDYEQKEGSPLMESDIRKDAPGMTWKEIRYQHIDLDVSSDDSDGLYGDSEESEGDD